MQNHNNMFVMRLAGTYSFAKLDFLLYTNSITSIYKPLLFTQNNYFTAGDFAVVVVTPYTLEQMKMRPGVFDCHLTEEDFVTLEAFRKEPRHSADEIKKIVHQQVTHDETEHNMALYDYYRKVVELKHTKQLSWEELAERLA